MMIIYQKKIKHEQSEYLISSDKPVLSRRVQRITGSGFCFFISFIL